MYVDWNWNDFKNVIVIAIVTGPTAGLLLLALKRWLRIEYPPKRVVSLGLVGSNFVIGLVNHFIPTRRHRR